MSARSSSWTNWAGTESVVPRVVGRPRSVIEVEEMVAAAAKKGLRVRAVGAGHSFTGAAVAPDVLLDLTRLDRVVSVDRAVGRVTVEAGIRLHRLNALLAREGLALENLGDIDRQSISGAVATGTHGTGARLGGLATLVAGLDLVRADGTLLSCSPTEHPDVFEAARLSLGAIGVVARMTLRTEPAFRLRAVERPEPLDDVLERLDEWVALHDHTEFYWFPHTDRTLTKANDRVEDEPAVRTRAGALPWWRRSLDDEVLSNGVFGLTNLLCRVAPAATPAVNRIASRALTGREYVDDSYRVFVSPRRVHFVESEYAVPRAAIQSVLSELRGWIDAHDARLPFPVEVRFAARDDVWLSTAYQRETAYVAVHQYHRMPYDAYFAAFESIARAHQGRPHWGKLHSLTSRELRGLYPRFDDVLAVRARLDPDRRFANPYLTRVFGP